MGSLTDLIDDDDEIPLPAFRLQQQAGGTMQDHTNTVGAAQGFPRSQLHAVYRFGQRPRSSSNVIENGGDSSDRSEVKIEEPETFFQSNRINHQRAQQEHRTTKRPSTAFRSGSPAAKRLKSTSNDLRAKSTPYSTYQQRWPSGPLEKPFMNPFNTIDSASEDDDSTSVVDDELRELLELRRSSDPRTSTSRKRPGPEQSTNALASSMLANGKAKSSPNGMIRSKFPAGYTNGRLISATRIKDMTEPKTPDVNTTDGHGSSRSSQNNLMGTGDRSDPYSGLPPSRPSKTGRFDMFRDEQASPMTSMRAQSKLVAAAADTSRANSSQHELRQRKRMDSHFAQKHPEQTSSIEHLDDQKKQAELTASDVFLKANLRLDARTAVTSVLDAGVAPAPTAFMSCNQLNETQQESRVTAESASHMTSMAKIEQKTPKCTTRLSQKSWESTARGEHRKFMNSMKTDKRYRLQSPPEVATVEMRDAAANASTSSRSESPPAVYAAQKALIADSGPVLRKKEETQPPRDTVASRTLQEVVTTPKLSRDPRQKKKHRIKTHATSKQEDDPRQHSKGPPKEPAKMASLFEQEETVVRPTTDLPASQTLDKPTTHKINAKQTTTKEPLREHSKNRSVPQLGNENERTLLSWRLNDNMTWKDMIFKWAALSGEQLNERQIKTRYSDLTEKALRERQWYPPDQQILGSVAADKSTPSPTAGAANENNSTNKHSAVDESPSQPPDERPTTGGKTWNSETMSAYIRAVQEEIHDEDRKCKREAMGWSREWSPATEDDIPFYEYTIERKTWYAPDTEADVNEWIRCGYRGSSLQKANLAASEEATTKRWEMGPGSHFTRSHIEYVDGDMYSHLIENAEGGYRVRVSRKLMTDKKGKKPDDKFGWLRKSIYQIHKTTRITMGTREEDDTGEEVDELFEDSPPLVCKEVTTETLEEKNAYTILDQANKEAADIAVDLMTDKNSRKIDDVRMRADKIRERDEMLEQLEEDGALYSHIFELEGKARPSEAVRAEVEIAVVEIKLVGPRNI